MNDSEKGNVSGVKDGVTIPGTPVSTEIEVARGEASQVLDVPGKIPVSLREFAVMLICKGGEWVGNKPSSDTGPRTMLRGGPDLVQYCTQFLGLKVGTVYYGLDDQFARTEVVVNEEEVIIRETKLTDGAVRLPWCEPHGTTSGDGYSPRGI